MCCFFMFSVRVRLASFSTQHVTHRLFKTKKKIIKIWLIEHRRRSKASSSHKSYSFFGLLSLSHLHFNIFNNPFYSCSIIAFAAFWQNSRHTGHMTKTMATGLHLSLSLTKCIACTWAVYFQCRTDHNFTSTFGTPMAPVAMFSLSLNRSHLCDKNIGIQHCVWDVTRSFIDRNQAFDHVHLCFCWRYHSVALFYLPGPVEFMIKKRTWFHFTSSTCLWRKWTCQPLNSAAI